MSTSSLQGDAPHSARPAERTDGDAPAPERRPRCAMIVNPYSSGMTGKRERAIVETLREQVDLDISRTERGGHAPKLAREILDAGQHDVIIACGGDGTVNEVLNGMALGAETADRRPRVAILPAGGTNVVARSIGFTNHPVKAAREVADAIVARRSRTINLATVDERTFLFSAGVGLDAEVVKRMEERRSGRRPSDAAHFASILGIYATSRFALADRMTIRIDATEEELRSALLIVGNMTPMTYLGRMPMHFLPDCRLESGMDLLAPHRANALFSIRNAAQAMGVGRSSQRLVSPEKGQVRHDVAGFTVTCDEPQPVQVDGEYIGDRTHITFGLLERAVDLVA
ncbi:MAG: diacylglycerol kinase [Thermoleophilia bacterium]|nr:diacylglycerol kinase [Thermoleophilia bacterium]